MASEAEHAQVVRQRQHRREVLALEEQVGNMQRLLDDTQRQMAGLQNHILRLRQKEAAALDTKKEAELLAAEKMRRAEELRLQVVAAQAGREAAEARAVAEREEREKEVAMAHKKELDRANMAMQLEQTLAARDIKVEEMRRRVQQLSGSIGGRSSKARSGNELSSMPTSTATARNAYSSAKHRVVAKLTDVLDGAKAQPQLIATALTKAGVLQDVLKKTKEG